MDLDWLAVDDRHRPDDPSAAHHQPAHERIADHVEPHAAHGIEVGERRVPADPADDVHRVRCDPDAVVGIGEIAGARDPRGDQGLQRRPAERGQLLISDIPDAQPVLRGGDVGDQVISCPPRVARGSPAVVVTSMTDRDLAAIVRGAAAYHAPPLEADDAPGDLVTARVTPVVRQRKLGGV